MDKCSICLKQVEQLFETEKSGVYACFKCMPLVPEVTIGDNVVDSEPMTTVEIDDNEECILDDMELSCGICHKTFSKNVQLQNHLRNHRAEKRFVCTYCNKAFSQSNNLRAHLRIHTNERPYKCSECGKAFTQVTNLNNHVRLHTGERPFVCPEPGCNKAYAQVTNLNQHRKRHLTGRPVENSYDCTVCGEQFAQRNHMYSHRRLAHSSGKGAAGLPGVPGGPSGPVVRLQCRGCSLVFSTKDDLLHHNAQMHLPQERHDEKGGGGSLSCVFSLCGARLSSPREHTEHLLRAHQLRVLAAPAEPRQLAAPLSRPRRGRPPKVRHTMQAIKVEEQDPLHIDPKEYEEVKICKETQYLPKLKVQSLFQ